MQITASEMWQVLDSDLHDHHQNTDRGKIFCKNDVKFPPVELQRLGQSRPLKLTKATVASYFCPTNIHSISHSLLLKAVQWTNVSNQVCISCFGVIISQLLPDSQITFVQLWPGGYARSAIKTLLHCVWKVIILVCFITDYKLLCRSHTLFTVCVRCDR